MMKIITIKEAQAQGLTHFYTGKKCKNGHLDKRHVSNRGCVTCNHNRSIAFMKAREGTTYHKDKWLKTTYGINFQEFQKMVNTQEGKCLTCQKLCEDLHVDHCHTNGQIRGLLCGPCNRALGMVYDNPETLKRMIDYLL